MRRFLTCVLACAVIASNVVALSRFPSPAHSMSSCMLGRSGSDCDLWTSCEELDFCNDHGVCLLGPACMCDVGWGGPSCSIKMCKNNCSYPNGECNQDASCTCSDKWTGESCSTPRCPGNGNCFGRGSCVLGICQCRPEFGGFGCEDVVCLNHCSGRGWCNTTSQACECDAGYSGSDCSLSDCLHDCSGHGSCDSTGSCLCDIGWSGSDCSLPVCSGCSNHGSCTMDGRCQCEFSWTGFDCSIRLCLGDCSGHGTCLNGTCICDVGWTSKDCSTHSDLSVSTQGAVINASIMNTSVCANNCSGHGSCELGICLCDFGFSGPGCEQLIDDSHCNPRCMNNGTCTNSTCRCAPGYTGTRCQTRDSNCPNGTCVSQCFNSCNGHGKCLMSDRGISSCLCDSGFGGHFCEVQFCRNNCSGNGVCMNGSCLCDPGYLETDCSIRHVIVSSAAQQCSFNCSGHGSCVNSSCICDNEWYGDFCNSTVSFVNNQSHSCFQNCFDHGSCLQGKCLCDAGWAGSHCNLTRTFSQLTCPQNCSGKGLCVNGSCFCDPEYGGIDCSAYLSSANSSCASNCHGHGLCFNNSCECDIGWAGQLCEIDIGDKSNCNGTNCTTPHADNFACLHHCGEHGSCFNNHCFCDPGWFGMSCDLQRCPGYSISLSGNINCSGHGVCNDSVTCFCDAGWSGPDCSTLACPVDCHLNGECRNGTCVCHPGFLGMHCELGPFQGDCYHNCSGHGHCVVLDPLFDPHTIECNCDVGWAGSDCSIPSCHQQCSGNGACNQDGSCICYSGWTGTNCAVPSCPNDCNSQGSCIGGSGCLCDIDFSGPDCSVSGCPLNCSLNGVCMGGNCSCFYGWGGYSCDSMICPSNCSNRGDCNNGTCVCNPGYFGVNCSDTVRKFSLQEVFPTAGTVLGGTQVYLGGTNFVDSKEIFVRFGDLIVKGQYQSMFLITAISPVNPSGASLLPVQLAIGGTGVLSDFADLSTETSVFTYQYYSIPVVHKVMWPFIPEAGGTSISVLGTSFQYSLAPRCRFGSIVSHGTISTLLKPLANGENEVQGFIICKTPSIDSHFGLIRGNSAVVQFSVSMNGGASLSTSLLAKSLNAGSGSTDFSFLQLSGWTEVAYFGADVVLPPAGTVYGNSVVQVVGYNIFRGLYIRAIIPDWNYRFSCRFKTPDGKSRIVPSPPSSYQSTAQGIVSFTCVTPAVGPGYAGNSQIFVSPNAELVGYSTDSITFAFLQPTPTYLSIQLAPSSGGSAITITGRDFLPNLPPSLPTGYPSPPSPRCRWIGGIFDGSGVINGPVFYSNGIWGTPSSVVCRSPNVTFTVASKTIFDIAVNGVDFSDSRIEFGFYPPLVLKTMLPTLSLMTANTYITISGNSFHSLSSLGVSPLINKDFVFCNFQAMYSITTPIERLTLTTVRCQTPPAIYIATFAQALSNFYVDVTVCMNGQDFALKPLPMLYFVTPVLNAVIPLNIANTGISVVTISGIGLVYTETAFCNVYSGKRESLLQSSPFFRSDFPVYVNIESAYATCVVPEGSLSGFSSIGISFDRSSVQIASQSVEIFQLLRVSPSIVPNSGTSTVIAFLEGVRSASMFQTICYFDSFAVSGVLNVSTSSVLCATPKVSSQIDAVNFAVSINNGISVSNIIPFAFHNPLSVDLVGPFLGSFLGNTLVVISIFNAPSAGYEAFCHFGLFIVSATHMNGNQYHCFSPGSAISESVVFSISLSFQDTVSRSSVTKSTMYFYFYGNISVSSVSPMYATTGSTAKITVTGNGFSPSNFALPFAQYKCKFAPVMMKASEYSKFNMSLSVTIASFVSPNIILCNVPSLISSSDTVTVNIGISVDAQFFVHGNNSVQLFNSLSLLLSPLGGPSDGGSPVSIKMLPDVSVPSLLINWGGSIFAVPRVDSTYNFVSTFQPIPSPISVSASLDGGQVFAGLTTFSYFAVESKCGNTLDLSSLSYTCNTKGQCRGSFCVCDTGFSALDCSLGPYIHSIHPCVLPYGFASSVTVQGINLIGAGTQLSSMLQSQYTLFFGSAISPASYNSTLRAILSRTPLIPAVAYPSPVVVSLSLPPPSRTLAFGSFNALFVPVPTIHQDVSPNVLHSFGGTVITVSGSKLFSTSESSCRFKHVLSAVSEDVSAVVISETRAVCTSPVLVTGIIQLSVSNDGFSFSNSVFLNSSGFPEPLNVFPTYVPDRGHTLITIQLGAVAPLPSILSHFSCRYIHRSFEVTVSANITERSFRCITPSNIGDERRSVALQVSYDGQNFSPISDSIRFYYVPDVTLTSVSPSAMSIKGGMLLTISATNLIESSQALCSWGVDVSAATFINSNAAHCVVPVLSTHGIISFSFLPNGQDATTAVPVIIFNPVVISTVFPCAAPLVGGSIISIYGISIVDTSPHCLCFFDDFGLMPLSISPGVARCPAPPQTQAGTVMLSISLDNGFSRSGAVQFVYFLMPTLTDILPGVGSKFSSTPLTIFGQNIKDFGANPRCQFGTDPPTNGLIQIFANSPVIRCPAPPPRNALVTYVTVEVSLDGQVFTKDRSIRFLYVNSFQVNAIIPSSGSVTGGTRITVTGTKFLSSTLTTCHWGTFTSNAEYVSETSFLCISPPVNTASIVTVRISLNSIASQACPSSNLLLQCPNAGQSQFRYYVDPTLVRIEPSFGRVTGGTAIQIFGSGFVSELLSTTVVIFDGSMRPATDVASTIMFATTPPSLVQLTRTISVSISLNLGLSTSATTVQFVYYVIPTLNGLEPIIGSPSGGTVLTVRGAVFINTGSLRCQFQKKSAHPDDLPLLGSSVTYLSPLEISCISPAADIGDYLVRVGLSQEDQDLSLTSMAFTYLPTALLTSVHPSAGPIDGGSRITVSGGVFSSLSSISCKFGSTISPGSFLNSGAVICVPSLAAAPGLVNLTISLNSQDWDIQPLINGYLYVLHPIISSVYPSCGPAQTETKITITGSGLFDFPSIKCRVGSYSHQAQYISSTSISCVALRVQSRTVAVAVTSFYSNIDPLNPDKSIIVEQPMMSPVSIALDGQVFAPNPLNFVYYPSPQVRSIAPSAVSKSSGSVIVVGGSGFISICESVLCRFGDSDPVEASVLSTTFIACVAPISPSGILIPLEISLNSFTFEGHRSVPVLMYATAPVITSFVVDPSGVFSRLSFDVTTDGGGYLGGHHFLCSMILDYDPVSLALLPSSASSSLGSLPTVAQVFAVLFGTNHYCMWSSALFLDIFMSDDAAIVPGIQITSKMNTIFRRDERSLSSSNYKALTIASSMLRPRVGLIAPSVVGSCSSFEIGAFDASGGAGRPATYSWNGRNLNGSELPDRISEIISTRNGTGTSVDGILCRHSGCAVCSNSNRSVVSCSSSNVSTITHSNCRCDMLSVPPNVLSPGSYVFSAQVKNWLGASSDYADPSSNVTVIVKSGSALKLTISPSNVAIFRDQQVFIAAQASLSHCVGDEYFFPTTRKFSWQLRTKSPRSSSTIVTIPEVDMSAEQLIIPPFMLSADSIYEITLNSQIDSMNQTFTATASASLTVLSAPISILVAQGERIVASVWEDLVIDTCSTKDIDGSSDFIIQYSCSFPDRPGIVCSDLDPSFVISINSSNSCYARVFVNQLTKKLPLPVQENILFSLQAFRTSRLSVVVGSVSVAVLLTPNIIPIVSIHPVSSPILRSGTLLVTASVLLPRFFANSNFTLNYSWSIPDMAGVSVPLFSNSSASLLPWALSKPGILSLVLNSSGISAPLFVLQFTATPVWKGSTAANTQSHSFSAASVLVSISIRDSPSGGSFLLNILKGKALSTTFRVSAPGWQDKTPSLIYSVQYLSEFNVWEEVARSTQSDFFFTLPFGRHNLQLSISNRHGATTTTDFCNGMLCIVDVESVSGITTDDAPHVLTSAFENALIQASPADVENSVRIIAHELNLGSPPISRSLSALACEYGCLNGASCISGACICTAGYSGPVCAASSESWSKRVALRDALIYYSLNIVLSTLPSNPLISSRLQLLRVATAGIAEVSQSSASRLSGALFGILYQVSSRKRKLDQVAFVALAGAISNVVAVGAAATLTQRQEDVAIQSGTFSPETINSTTVNSTVVSNSSEFMNISQNNISGTRKLLAVADHCDASCSFSKSNILMILELISAMAPPNTAFPPVSQTFSSYAYSVVKVDMLYLGDGRIRALNSLGYQLSVRGATLVVPFIDFPSYTPADLTAATKLSNGDLASGSISTAALTNRPDLSLVLIFVSFGPGASPLSWHPSDSSVISDIMAIWVTPASGPLVILSVPKNVSHFPPAWSTRPIVFYGIRTIKLRRAVNPAIFPDGKKFVPVCSLWVDASNNFSLNFGNVSFPIPIGGNGYWSDGACYAASHNAGSNTVDCQCSSSGLIAVREYPAGCDGVPNGQAVLDQCNVCGGSGTSCLGCDNVPFSGKTLDSCGVCDGDDSSCNACKNPCPDRSRRFLDACGVCGGNNQSCTGCDGVLVPPQVTARTGLRPKVKDACGVCGGTGKSCAGCDGVPFSGKEFDLCGVCDPPLAQRNICPELPTCLQGSILDACGTCVPLTDTGGLACVGCDNVPRLFGRKLFDACGICGGDNSSCVDCLGVPNGKAKRDKCGVCNGNNACADCCGEPFGIKQLDVCGVCNGPNNSAVCTGCDGVITPPPRRPAIFDSQLRCCPFDLIGCNGLCQATVGCDGICQRNSKRFDKCGVCGGQGLPLTGSCDCAALPNGTSAIGCDGVCRYEPKVVDKCNVCGGKGLPQTGICDCKAIPHGENVVDSLGLCCHPSEIGCDSICFSGKLMDSCFECAGYFSCSVFDSCPSIVLGREVFFLWSLFVFILLSFEF